MTSLWHTVRLVLQSSPISLPFISFRTSPHVPRLPTPFSPYLSFALPPSSRPPCHKKKPTFLSSYPSFLSSKSLEDFSRSPSLYPTSSPPSAIIPIPQVFKFTSSLPLSPTHYYSLLPPAPPSDTACCASFYVSLDIALELGCLLPLLGAASGKALQPMPGWASHWLFLALSTLSLLRQAKIN